jgi:hypothetical protein
MINLTDREKLTIEDIAKAGIETLFINERYWLTPANAAALLSWLNGRTVDVKYISNLVRDKRVNPWRQGRAHFSYYALDELTKIVVREHGGRPAGHKLSKVAKDSISEGQRRRWEKWKEEKEKASV